MPHVLIVDDEPSVRRMISLAFELEGFDVTTASDGADAIVQVQLADPDVVIMDIMMPRLDGLTVLGHLRRQAGTTDLPVLLLSAKADSADIAIGMRAGADDYVTKPFDMEDLVQRTRQALGASVGSRRSAAPSLPVEPPPAPAVRPAAPVAGPPAAPQPVRTPAVEPGGPPQVTAPSPGLIPAASIRTAEPVSPRPPERPVDTPGVVSRRTVPAPAAVMPSVQIPDYRAPAIEPGTARGGLVVWAALTLLLAVVGLGLRWLGLAVPLWVAALVEVPIVVVAVRFGRPLRRG